MGWDWIVELFCTRKGVATVLFLRCLNPLGFGLGLDSLARYRDTVYFRCFFLLFFFQRHH
jgi:hypothetical protein